MDTSGDSGWTPPFGKSRVNWYVLAGLVLEPDSDHKAFLEAERLLRKYVRESERRRYPDQFYEIHYHDIVMGNNIFQGLTGLQKKAMCDEVFDLVVNVIPHSSHVIPVEPVSFDIDT